MKYSNEFLKYVGPRDIHDSTIVSVNHVDDAVEIVLKSYKKSRIKIKFTGVKDVYTLQSEGMIVYSLSEMKSDDNKRIFTLANSNEEEESKSCFEIVCDDISFE